MKRRWFGLLLAGSLSAHANAAERFLPLDVADFSPSLVYLPEGTDKAPVLIVTHGAGGTAAAHCNLWQHITRGKAVLLCVSGRSRSQNPEDGQYYPDHSALERETFAALAALKERYAARIADGPAFYAGFSQGATMGARMLVEHASEISRLVLVEGGFAEWSVARAKSFHEHGGERILFVCGRKECAEPARLSAHWCKLAGLDAAVEYVPGAGHVHDGRVEERIIARYPWFVAGDARWTTD